MKQMSIEILSLIDHHHHAVMPKSFDVAELARYTLALGKLCRLHENSIKLNQFDVDRCAVPGPKAFYSSA